MKAGRWSGDVAPGHIIYFRGMIAVSVGRMLHDRGGDVDGDGGRLDGPFVPGVMPTVVPYITEFPPNGLTRNPEFPQP